MEDETGGFILTQGTRGDVEPYVALGLGLHRAGYEVRLAASYGWHNFVTRRGLSFSSVDDDGGDTAQKKMLQDRESREWRVLRQSQLNVLSTIFHLACLCRVTEPNLERRMVGYWRACQGSDVVVASALGYAGLHIGNRLGIPCYWALLQPLCRTRAFPHPMAPRKPQWGGSYNLLTHIIAEHLSWWFTRVPTNRWRQRVLGLPALGLRTPYMLTGDRHTPVLFGFSPAVLPKPADWGSQLHVTGYWFLEYPAGWTPPDNLAGFLDVGSPPVSIGFGSMGLTDPVGREDFLKMALEALSLSGQRGILLTSDKKHRGGVKLSDRALLLDSCPYSWLFPRMAVVVHHGGVGTAAAGLRTGVPTVTIPVYTDQPFWGWRVAEIGVGPAPIPRHKLTVQRLAKAIIGAASDLGVRAMAAALGKRIRNEDGVGRAVELLHSHFPSIDSHTREMGVDRKSDAHTGV